VARGVVVPCLGAYVHRFSGETVKKPSPASGRSFARLQQESSLERTAEDALRVPCRDLDDTHGEDFYVTGDVEVGTTIDFIIAPRLTDSHHTTTFTATISR